jgi:hypothetical protein
MNTIKQLFEQEVVKKIQANNQLDKKLEESKLGFNRGISYLGNLCEQLQEHIPTLSCEFEVKDNKTSGHFVFYANNFKIVIQFWGKYNDDGSQRMGFNNQDDDYFVLFYENMYFKDGETFEKLLVANIVNKLKVIQMQ